MGTFNFHPDHNTPYKAVFCLWEDRDDYKNDIKEEYGEDSEEYQRELSDDAYSYWCDFEKDYYMELLQEDLQRVFGNLFKNNMNERAYDGQQVCSIGKTWTFGNMNFYTEVGIYLEAGYYEGFALDWKINSMLDCYTDEVPDIPDAIDYLRDDFNEGLAVALAPKFIKRCEKELASITDKLDDILMHLAPHCMTIGWCCGEHKDEYLNNKAA